MAETNGKMKWIFTLVGFIFVIFTTTLGYTWGAVAENRKSISDVKDCLASKLEIISGRLSRIEALLEK